MNCRRCGEERTNAVSSMFDGELICKACQAREKNHPEYQEAFNAIRKAVEGGNYRYSGIGLPEDLKVETNT